MALGVYGTTLLDELNRLANGGTYRTPDQMVDEAKAAGQWAVQRSVTTNYTNTVGILNAIDGRTDPNKFLDYSGICNFSIYLWSSCCSSTESDLNLSARYNLVCNQATTFNFVFTININNVPLNLSGYTGVMTVRPFVGANTTTVVASTANGRMTLSGLSGNVSITIDATTTGAISAGRYAYDLVLTSGSTVTRYLQGRFIVTGAVTT
jgi:hypothetical protein